MTTFSLEIITQEKILLQEEAESLYATTADGDITVLPHHLPYVGILKPAEIIIKRNGAEESFTCTGGILEVTPDKVVVLADSVVRSAEIDEAEAIKAKENAEKIMSEKLEERENAEAEASLERALLHLRVLKKRKHHTS